MISRDTYLLPIWISLFVQSLTWSLSDSRPEKVAHLSIFDDDFDDWLRRRSTRNPWDWLFGTTTRDPYIDWLFGTTTRSPYIWNKYTVSPDYKYDKTSRSSGTEPYVWVIVGVTILISLLIGFIRYACAHNDDDDTYDSSPVLHPPPAVIVPPPERTYQPTAVIPPPQYLRNTISHPVRGGPYDHRAPTVPPPNGAGDKPPGYSEVVMADSVEETKYPEVAPRPLDTPPPKYEDGILPKY